MTNISLRRPTDADIAAALERNLNAPYSYDFVGASRTQPPAGWRYDDQRIEIGTSADMTRALDVLRNWGQFDLHWVHPYRQDVPITPGALFAFCSYQYGIWALNICRIVYLIEDDSEEMTRVGFAYGTVGDHAVRGEETFSIELDKTNDQLFFRTTKFSRPAQLLTYLVLPLTTMAQDRFTRDALNRVRQEVTN